MKIVLCLHCYQSCHGKHHSDPVVVFLSRTIEPMSIIGIRWSTNIMVIDPVTSHNTFQIYYYEDYYLRFFLCYSCCIFIEIIMEIINLFPYCKSYLRMIKTRGCGVPKQSWSHDFIFQLEMNILLRHPISANH